MYLSSFFVLRETQGRLERQDHLEYLAREWVLFFLSQSSDTGTDLGRIWSRSYSIDQNNIRATGNTDLSWISAREICYLERDLLSLCRPTLNTALSLSGPGLRAELPSECPLKGHLWMHKSNPCLCTVRYAQPKKRPIFKQCLRISFSLHPLFCLSIVLFSLSSLLLFKPIEVSLLREGEIGEADSLENGPCWEMNKCNFNGVEVLVDEGGEERRAGGNC